MDLSPSIENCARSILPVSHVWLTRAQERLDNLTKPPGSLGRLEELARRYCGIRQTVQPVIKKRAIYVFAGDHGVTAEGVSAYPREVTGQMVRNFLAGGAAINALAHQAGAEVRVVDMGVDADLGALPGLIHRKIARGTQNFANAPAMTREQALASIEAGIGLACSSPDTDVFATGDMGIGNTTSATAILLACGRNDVLPFTGRGTGIDDPGLRRKADVISNALRTHQPDPSDPVGLLARVGGFEIGGIAGLILGAGEIGRPVFIDGLISSSGAVVAALICPRVRDYILPSHRSAEPAHRIAFDLLGLSPLFDLSMRLGEGTGAAIGISLLDAAIAVFNRMATFQGAGVSEKS